MIYELYALTSQYDTFTKKITRKNPLTKEQEENLSRKFADNICDKKNINVILYGCNLFSD